jgi:hypothetical protein
MQLTVAERKVNPFSYTKVVIIRLIDFFSSSRMVAKGHNSKKRFVRKWRKSFPQTSARSKEETLRHRCHSQEANRKAGEKEETSSSASSGEMLLRH